MPTRVLVIAPERTFVECVAPDERVPADLEGVPLLLLPPPRRAKDRRKHDDGDRKRQHHAEAPPP